MMPLSGRVIGPNWLAKEGAAAPALSVLAATRRVMAQQKQWLAARRAG